MDINRYVNVSAAAIVGTNVPLIATVTGLDPGVVSRTGDIRTLLSVNGSCGSTVGTLQLMVRNTTVAAIDLVSLKAAVAGLPINIPVAIGDTLTVSVLSTSGTDVCYVTLGCGSSSS